MLVVIPEDYISLAVLKHQLYSLWLKEETNNISQYMVGYVINQVKVSSNTNGKLSAPHHFHLCSLSLHHRNSQCQHRHHCRIEICQEDSLKILSSEFQASLGNLSIIIIWQKVTHDMSKALRDSAWQF